MRDAHWHRFRFLLSDPERVRSLDRKLEWTPNIWMGVDVETSNYAFRIDHLRSTGARVKFLSLEPLLAPLPALDLTDIDWVIVGGESGPRARPIDPAWVREIRDQCLAQNVAFFFKQWGGVFKKRTGGTLDGRTWDNFEASR